MSLLQDCSELLETARLVGVLLKPHMTPNCNSEAAVPKTPATPYPIDLEPAASPGIAEAKPPVMHYRGDRLCHILATMCKRGGLSGAVVADSKGLPLADFNSPVGGDVLAAFTSVLGNALERAATLLGEAGADLISMDINYTDKIVLRRFRIEGAQYFFLVICPQELDERTEVELSIEQVSAILTE